MNIPLYTSELHQYLTHFANAAIAQKQEQYMRNRYKFFGLMKNELTHKFKEYETLSGIVAPEKALEFAENCFEFPEREMWYIGINCIKKNKKKLKETNLLRLVALIEKGDWWDIVDTISSNNIGTLIMKYPALSPQIQEFIYHDNFWLRRMAIIYQLTYRANTDEQFLYKACQLSAHEKEFFIQKAIGWSLREYAKHNPNSVLQFLEKNKNILSKLSLREAYKHLPYEKN